ncbi:hypothetical protein GCM10011325_25290 [Dyadobacter sediminis]|nr:hypothetical protein GCM10011325_25290 [Dyadobacter sediminis]
MAVAQSDTLKWHPGIKLKFSDFTIDQSTTHAFADIIVYYDYSSSPMKFGRYFPLTHADAIFNRKTASLPDSSEKNLRYAQLLFDLSGYESRLIKLKAMELGELNARNAPVKQTMDDIFFKVNNEISLLKKDMTESISKSGDEQVLSEWEAKVAALLQSTPEVITETTLGKWQVGMFMGIAQSYFSGKSSHYFTTATGLDYGLNVDLKRSRLVFDVNLDFNKTKIGFEQNGNWQTGMKTHFASVEITYGFKLPKNKWLAVPYAGLSLNELTPRRPSDEDKRSLDGAGPVIGLEINRFFGNMTDSWENVNLFYKCRASFNPANLIKDNGGTQFNLKIAVGFDTRRVKSRLAKKM